MTWLLPTTAILEGLEGTTRTVSKWPQKVAAGPSIELRREYDKQRAQSPERMAYLAQAQRDRRARIKA